MKFDNLPFVTHNKMGFIGLERKTSGGCRSSSMVAKSDATELIEINTLTYL